MLRSTRRPTWPKAVMAPSTDEESTARAYPGSAARTCSCGSRSTAGQRTPLRGAPVLTKSSGRLTDSRRLASRSSKPGPPSALAYSKTRNGTPADVVPEIASSTLRTKPRPNGGA